MNCRTAIFITIFNLPILKQSLHYQHLPINTAAQYLYCTLSRKMRKIQCRIKKNPYLCKIIAP